jgi:hypothetical protein
LAVCSGNNWSIWLCLAVCTIGLSGCVWLFAKGRPVVPLTNNQTQPDKPIVQTVKHSQVDQLFPEQTAKHSQVDQLFPEQTAKHSQVDQLLNLFPEQTAKHSQMFVQGTTGLTGCVWLFVQGTSSTTGLSGCVWLFVQGTTGLIWLGLAVCSGTNWSTWLCLAVCSGNYW